MSQEIFELKLEQERASLQHLKLTAEDRMLKKVLETLISILMMHILRDLRLLQLFTAKVQEYSVLQYRNI